MPLLTDLAELAHPPRRIVSLVPSLTETVAELGGATELVGVTDWCWYPAEVTARLPKVGGTKNPKIERIRALGPDLILVNEEENRKEDVLALAKEFPCWVTFPKEVADNRALIQSLGAALGQEGRATAASDRIAALEIEVAARVAARESRSLAYLIWQKPWMTINRDTYIAAVLAFLNCTNPWALAPERYPSLTDEELVTADPALICLASEPFPFEETHRQAFCAQFPQLTAVQRGNVFIGDGTYFCWYGTRWERALEWFRVSPWFG